MNLELKYQEETGEEATYTVEAPNNCNRFDTHYTGDYIEWLEGKAAIALQQPNAVDAKKPCEFCKVPPDLDYWYFCPKCGRKLRTTD